MRSGSSSDDDSSVSGSGDDSDGDLSPIKTPIFHLATPSPSPSPRGRSWLRNGRIPGWGGEPEPEIIRKQKAEDCVQEFAFSSMATVWALTTAAMDIYRIAKDPKAELKNILFAVGALIRLAMGYLGAKGMARKFYMLTDPLGPDCRDMGFATLLIKLVHYFFSDRYSSQMTPFNSQLASNKTAVLETLKGFAPVLALVINVILASIKARVDPTSRLPLAEFKILFPLMLVPNLVLHLKMMAVEVESKREDREEDYRAVTPG
ncbi:MAG: hypothetical protein P1U34_00740 [Coxiellaceae bacterium]|nr:hypothetical protein [Coxiellaceae bacterium]